MGGAGEGLRGEALGLALSEARGGRVWGGKVPALSRAKQRDDRVQSARLNDFDPVVCIHGEVPEGTCGLLVHIVVAEAQQRHERLDSTLLCDPHLVFHIYGQVANGTSRLRLDLVVARP